MPWPPPMHIVTIPRRPSRRSSACISLTVRIAPVAPIGWPRAIAPPETFTRLRIEADVADDCDGLGCERLVELDEVDVGEGEARALERLRDRERRRVAHHLGLDAADGPGAEAQPGGQAAASCLGLAHQDDRRGAVVDPRRVAGGDGAIFPEHGPELREPVGGRPGARVLVAGERSVGARNVDRDDLRLEMAGLDRRDRALLTAQREGVLLVARDAVALCDDLRRVPHRVAAERVGHQRERPVEELPRPEAVAVPCVVVEEGLAAHRLVASGHDDRRLIGEDLLRAGDDRLEARGAQAVDVHRRRAGRDPGRDRTAAGVVGIRADLADLAHHDLVDVARDRRRLERAPRGCRPPRARTRRRP